MKIKVIILLTIISLLSPSCALVKKINYPQYIKTSTYEGVILPEAYEKTWLPDKKMVSNFESGLEEYLNSIYLKSSQNTKNKNNSTINVYGDISFVIRNIKDYKRQYWGIFDKGKKELYCNFILITPDNISDNWKTQPVIVFDGGAYYFNVTYNPKANKYLNIGINGVG